MLLDPRDYPDRGRPTTALIVELLRPRDVGLVCLAGFMRLVGHAAARGVSRARSSTFIRRCCRRSRALDAQRQALEHGVRVSGATVHLVTAELDDGPIVAAGRGAGARR